MPDVFSQSGTARSEIYAELASLRLIDPHTHINPHAPASTTLADLLGYHYYTELAHSAGMPKARIEDKSIGPKELVERLVGGLPPLENTVQYSWLIEICKMFFGFDEDRLHLNNWEALYDRSESIMSSAQWPDMVLDQSNIEAVFLTNDFDDDLAGFDSDRYIPCLRTDDLVFHLADPVVRERLAKCTGIELDGSLSTLRASLRELFVHFVGRGARACAISLPPSFTPTAVADGRASTALDAVLRGGLSADPSHRDALSRRVFWTLAELCNEFDLPFDLMIGVNRKVYPAGVYQGQDLYDSRVSLIQYRDLFNTFTDVKFPVSVLASVTNQELVSYAWIFPNVIPNGHWWYSNTPSIISLDLAARLEAVPQTKLIGYYSDAYKLEFVWPKFNMYRKVLAGVLADQFVRDRGWSVERAVELGRRVLKDNTEDIFPRRSQPQSGSPEPDQSGQASDSDRLGPVAVTGAAALAAGLSADVDSEVIADEPQHEVQASQPDDQTPIDEETPLELADGLDALDAASPLEVADIDSSVPPAIAEDEETGGESEVSDAAEKLPQSEAPQRDEFELDAEGTEDPLPDEAEIAELDLDDVELLDPSAESPHDAATIGKLLDDEPLDAADRSVDEERPTESTAAGPQIQHLRGETSFSPDEESLQLKPDPLTGELRFGTAADSQSETAPNELSADAEDGKTEENDDFDLDWLSEDDNKPAK